MCDLYEFFVWCPELDQTRDDAVGVLAISPDIAAEQWAEERDKQAGGQSMLRFGVAVEGQSKLRFGLTVNVEEPDGAEFPYYLEPVPSVSYHAQRQITWAESAPPTC